MPPKALRKTGLTIGEIADRTGLAPSAIRYYEDEGLIAPDRAVSGQRRYQRADIRRLSFIMIAQELGFSLADIRAQITHLPSHRAPGKSDWTRIGTRFGKVLDARIAQMQQLRNKLDNCIGCGCLSLTDCTLYNPEDRAARRGIGPRYLKGDKPLE